MTSGEKDLAHLLQSMEPQLQEDTYVFCTVPFDRLPSLPVSPLCQFREAEGMTLILRQQEATNAGVEYSYVSRMITLSVHSSLEAIGFLAAITQTLAAKGISVNPVSAYYHDHLFVPADQAEYAMQLLLELTQQ